MNKCSGCDEYVCVRYSVKEPKKQMLMIYRHYFPEPKSIQ